MKRSLESFIRFFHPVQAHPQKKPMRFLLVSLFSAVRMIEFEIAKNAQQKQILKTNNILLFNIFLLKDWQIS